MLSVMGLPKPLNVPLKQHNDIRFFVKSEVKRTLYLCIEGDFDESFKVFVLVVGSKEGSKHKEELHLFLLILSPLLSVQSKYFSKGHANLLIRS